MPNAHQVLLSSAARAMRPRKRLTLSEWSDAHRVLTSKGASEPGRWRTSRTPYLREIMDGMSVHSPVSKVVVRKCSQSGLTEVALNWVGYCMDHAPSPMLLVEPTLEARDRLIVQRINPLLEETECIADIFDNKARRKSTNSKDVKDFPGGVLVMSGANSPASLASMPIKNVIVDEVDRYPWDVGGEGDPMGLIAVRQSTFPRRKTLEISSPTIKGASRIDEDYEAGDQRQWIVPCPHCSEALVLGWKNLHWSLVDGRVRDAWYVCEHCGVEIEEHFKPQMLAAGVWKAQKPDAPYRSYHINALMLPIGLGLSWLELAVEWIDAQNDLAKLKRFINTRLGEAWEDQSHDIKPAILAERAEEYALRTVPPGCLLLTCGIDTQDDRLALQVLGWGRDAECWVIDWLEIPGKPDRLLGDAAKGEGVVFDYLTAPFRNTYGKDLKIQAAAIDTGGHYTHDVYAFVRSRCVPRLMAIKGSSIPNKPVLAPRPTAQDVNRRGKIIKRGVQLWMVGSDSGKHVLFNRMNGDGGVVQSERKLHFPAGLEDDYYKQLLAEVFDPEKNKWVKRRGRRNEGTDTWVYGLAASQHPELRVQAMRKRDWDRLEQMLEPKDVDGGSQEAVLEEAVPAAIGGGGISLSGWGRGR